MEPLFYAVLVRLSPGYSPLIGRLHTRYSPVRRSPPMYCYIVLPLDLHVLSLSLAFILSQDQTLHSIKTVKKLFLSPVIDFLVLLQGLALAVLSLQYFIRTLVSSCKGLSPQNEGAKVTAKIHQQIIPSKHFANFFLTFFKRTFSMELNLNVHPLKAGAKIK